jgi:uncharacterized protein
VKPNKFGIKYNYLICHNSKLSDIDDLLFFKTDLLREKLF